MSYTSQRQKLEVIDNQAAVQTLKEFEKTAIESFGYIDIEQYKDTALTILYEDLIQSKTDYDFKTALGNSSYTTSNNFAFDCLDISLYSKNLYKGKIPNWTKTALHCFDVLLIHYISNILNEVIPLTTGRVKETDVYSHLIAKGNEYSEIGTKFQSIYQFRSQFEHLHYTDENGKRQVKAWSTKKLNAAKELILKFFKEALVHLLLFYKNSKPVTA